MSAIWIILQPWMTPEMSGVSIRLCSSPLTIEIGILRKTLSRPADTPRMRYLAASRRGRSAGCAWVLVTDILAAMTDHRPGESDVHSTAVQQSACGSHRRTMTS